MSKRTFYVSPCDASKGTWSVLRRRSGVFHDPHARGKQKVREMASIAVRTQIATRSEACSIARALNADPKAASTEWDTK